MNNIYLTSDLHFCHNREFLYGPRGFTCVEDMNEAIISNWNSIIKKDDDVYLLGDLMLSDTEKGLECLSRLKGNIHIIRGNHDTDTRLIRYIFGNENIKDIQEIKRLSYNNYNFYLSHYPTLCSNYDCDKPLNSRLINLCGHTHTQNWAKDMDKGLIYHCELDAHNNTPVLLDKIINDLNKWVENVQSKK